MEVNAGILQRDFFCAPQNSLGEAALGLTAGFVRCRSLHRRLSIVLPLRGNKQQQHAYLRL